MIVNMVGPFTVNAPFGTEIAFKKGLEQAGITVVTCDPNIERVEQTLSKAAVATVVFKSALGQEGAIEWLCGSDRTVLYQPDDMRFPHIRQMAVDMRPYCDHFLSFDETSAEIAQTMGYKNCRKMLVTADPDVYYYDNPTGERPVDVCMVASLGDPVAHASRRRIAQIARDYCVKKGLRYEIHDGIRDPSVIRRMYSASKVVINHATDVGQSFGLGYGLQCRHFEVAMTQTCLLSNQLYGIHPSESPPFEMFVDPGEFLVMLRMLINREEFREESANDLHAWVRIGHLPVHRGLEMKKYIEEIVREA